MRRVMCVFMIVLFAGAILSNPSRPFSLYGDKKAKRIDDIITVLIIENASATNKTKTGTGTESEVGFNTGSSGGGLMSYLPTWGFSGKNSANYKGQGETSRMGELKAKVTARVIEVHDNGNLLIHGSKLVEINNEKEMIHVSGIIRPEDIAVDNTILSSSIADANITYTGEGVNQDAQNPGLLTRFFTWLF
ncbi:MAG: flagellar basal body L-ring protein FlgH [Fibrobacteres bacterium]|nr:flagellar basal body L-ring protein FlgH [Fibrobacterota bacterium]